MNVENGLKTFELDELYWFIGQKAKTETRENVCLMMMVRKLETLLAVLEVFVAAYNRFGVAKHKYRQTRQPQPSFAKEGVFPQGRVFCQMEIQAR